MTHTIQYLLRTVKIDAGGEDAGNTEAFDGIGYKYSAFAYCDKCEKKIARHIKD